MEFEWDEQKSRLNVKKHGISFEKAPEVFTRLHLTRLDTRREYGEDRYLTLGFLMSRVVVVAHTPRHGVTRIISMRKANAKEQKIFYQEVQRFKEAGLDI